MFLYTCSRIPGQLTDRRTMLGELNWIFTAITDTIAWNTLPRGKISVTNLLTQNKSIIKIIVKMFSYL